MTQKIRAAWLAWHRWAFSKTGKRIGLVLLVAMFLYFLTGAFSAHASTNVYGYDTAQECWEDAESGTSLRGRSQYEDEWELIVRGEYDYYVADGQCYTVTDKMREMVNLSYRMTTAENTVSIGVGGWFLKKAVGGIYAAATAIGTYWGIEAVAREEPIDIYVHINEDQVIDALRDPCAFILKGAVTGTAAGAYLKCLEQFPRSTGPDDRTLAPAPASSSNTEPVPTLSDVLAKARDRFNNGEFSGSRDPVGDAIRAEYRRVQSMMNNGGYSAADKKKFTQLLKDVAGVLGAYYAALHMEHEDEPHVIPSVWPTLPGID